MPYLHEVFQLSGVPKITFVEPAKYPDIMVSLRTPGRCMVIEGPSGIGKSTTIQKALQSVGLTSNVLLLTPRQLGDEDVIAELPTLGNIGTVIVDDFHRLKDTTKEKLADFMKVLADNESADSKLILIGINKAGNKLIQHAGDLGLRVDVFKLESNSEEKIEELITLGEKALNITIERKEEIAGRAEGSFQIAQLLCHKICTLSGVIETQPENKAIGLSPDGVVEDVMIDLTRIFKEATLTFARGSKLRREGRAPYLHMLHWLANGDDWSLDLSEAANRYPEHKQSITQVLEKGHLSALLAEPSKEPILSPHFHFEPSTSVLSAEDPKLIFYLKNIVWRAFTREVGYKVDYFESRYDFALSFAGPDRSIARRLHELLTEREVSCFYDLDEQHRIVAANVEEYLAPIYRSEAKYVLPLLSSDYPNRIWTKFESDHFRSRFGENAVIPIRFTSTAPGWLSEEHRYGSLPFDPATDPEPQLQEIVETLCRRLVEDREASNAAASAEP